MASNREARPTPLQHLFGRALRFVGGDGGAVTALAQRRQRLGDAGIGAAVLGCNTFINLKKPLVHGLRLGRLAAARGEAAGEQHRHPVADHRANLLRTQRRIAAFAQGFVNSVGQIWKRVDQRPIEVEQQKELAHRSAG